MPMGLFDSAKKNDLIICPYCFNKFSASNVHFRDEFSDEVEVDEKLDHFYRNLKHTDNVAVKLRKAYDPERDPGEKRIVKITTPQGNKIKILDGFKPSNSSIFLTKRLCPVCHNDLPQQAGVGSTKVIAVVGTTQIGKTIFINSLITELMKVNSKFRNITFGFADKEMNEEYQLAKKAIELGEVKPTDRVYMKPTICTLFDSASRLNTIITFYDFPGESSAEDIQKFSKDQFISSDALLILFDLTRTKSLFDACKLNAIREMQENVNRLIEGLGFTEEQIEKLSQLNSDLPNTEALERTCQSLKTTIETLNKQLSTADEIQKGRIMPQLNNAKANLEKSEQLLDEANSVINKFKEDSISIIGKEVTPEEIEAIKVIRHNTNEINKKRVERVDSQVTSTDWIMTTYNSAFPAAEKSAARDRRPVAFVGTKSDEILRAVQNGCLQDEGVQRNIGVLAEPVKANGIFDSASADRIDAFVQNQLLMRPGVDNDGDFINYINGNFENKQFFAISALGTRYLDQFIVENGKKKAVRRLEGHKYITYTKDTYDPQTGVKTGEETVTALDGQIVPWRVDEPMLWLLKQLGIING